MPWLRHRMLQEQAEEQERVQPAAAQRLLDVHRLRRLHLRRPTPLPSTPMTCSALQSERNGLAEALAKAAIPSWPPFRAACLAHVQNGSRYDLKSTSQPHTRITRWFARIVQFRYAAAIQLFQ